MATRLRWILLILLIILVAIAGWQPSRAQTSGELYFPETGHWVIGDFLKAYRSVNDPLLLYGYPITDAFQDLTTGLIVQYFQRARFELHLDAPPDQRVQLSPLGEFLHANRPPLTGPSNSSLCEDFPETGFQVCYAFLDFFNHYGGVDQFGAPISNFEFQDDRIVQYFERARFEWHPEYPSGQRVTLTDVGSQYFSVHGENPIRLLPSQDNNALRTVLSLNLRAFTKDAVTSPEGLQTVYVIVQDQNLSPVPDAKVTISVQLPSGQPVQYPLPLTNEHGITQYTFNFSAQSKGIAKITATVTLDNLQDQTVTSFRIWW